MQIPFNKPYFSGKEISYIKKAIQSGKISGDGMFTKKCHSFFEKEYGFKKVLLTSSCTDALEMTAILAGISPGDEVIMPSFTFVSTANAFALRGAKIVFADSSSENPNIDVAKIEALITPKTKVIVLVHYAGIACQMDEFDKLAKQYHLMIIEDAAMAIDSFYKGKALGSFGNLSTFSFHESKNIISGEGGMLAVNDSDLIKRSEIVWEKGTNRSAFFRGEVNKYGWVDLGSSFLPSELNAAFLYAQLENMKDIQSKRKKIWNNYFDGLSSLKSKEIGLPVVPDYATNNGHLFYLICRCLEERSKLIKYLKEKEIMAVFHYLSLHKSPYFAEKHDGRVLSNADFYTDHLVRLPLFYKLTDAEQSKIINAVLDFYK